MGFRTTPICPSLTCFQSPDFLELLLSWQRQSWLPAHKDVLHQRSDSTSSTSNEPRVTLNATPKRDTCWVYQLYQYDLWSGNQRPLLGRKGRSQSPRFSVPIAWGTQPLARAAFLRLEFRCFFPEASISTT